MSSHFCGNRTSNHVIIVILIKGARGSAFFYIYIKSIFNWALKSIFIKNSNFLLKIIKNSDQILKNRKILTFSMPFLTIFSQFFQKVRNSDQSQKFWPQWQLWIPDLGIFTSPKMDALWFIYVLYCVSNLL